MGDLKVCPPHPNGVSGVSSEAGEYNTLLRYPPNPHPLSIGADIWLLAEQATQEIIRHIQPTVVSEQRRKAVVEYVQKLIRGFLSSEVFPFGSVPLKTYLPDGDIDLTAIGIPNSEDVLASDVRFILEGEEHNMDAEFQVKDVQYIHAEVKLVKCLVQNIVVDISFNQIGGLCTLCFLEQVDRLIGKDHLFKRSIILIKAWCYYESRILGAHHGLISTYALETLVLYIFHLFHSSLNDPLAVLYRFLDYYSKFDWDNYCISLNGPVSISSLPKLSAEIIDNDGNDLFLTKEFLRSCVETFSAPAKGSESNSQSFMKKHLNIVDPLRESNNLGRSVSKGNFYRIRSAFAYGARKLGRLLVLPAGSIVDEVNMFFMNTIDRHGSGERPDLQDLIPKSLETMSDESNGLVEKLEKEKPKKKGSDAYTDLNQEMKNIRISSPVSGGFFVNGVSHGRLINDARDLATARPFVSGTIGGNHKALASTSEAGSPNRKPYHAPHLFFLPENVAGEDLKLDTIVSANSDTLYSVSTLNEETRDNDSSSSNSWINILENSRHGHHTLKENEENSIRGSPGVLIDLSDLCGDYEIHFSSLVYAQWCQEQIIGTYFVPFHRSASFPYHHGKDVWSRGSMFAPLNANGLSPKQPFSPTPCYPITPTGNHGSRDVPKPRGTGTYFPNMNYRVYKERNSPGRVKNPVSPNPMSRAQNNGCIDMLQVMNPIEKVSHESDFQAAPMFSGNGRRRPPALLDIPQSPLPLSSKASPHANGFVFPPGSSRFEFGSLGPLSTGTPVPEQASKSDFAPYHGQALRLTSPGSSLQRRIVNSNRERNSQSYQLKDNDDFPPLSG